MKNRFNTNIALLRTHNTKLAYQLPSVDANDIEFCKTEQGELNLKRTYQGVTYSYHSQKSAMQEADEWFKGLNLTSETVLSVYGIGLGYYYEAAKNWLKENPQRALVFLEHDPAVICRFLETERATKLLRDPQVHLHHFTDPIVDKTLFNELSWTFIQCPFRVSALKLYADLDAAGFAQLEHQIAFQSAEKLALVDEYLQYGVSFFRNFYYNLFQLPHAHLGNGLFGKFDNVPAIICGAGPSLDKHLDKLTALKTRALLFAGGSSLNALASKKITPHFGAGIDPNSLQHERIKETAHLAVPFFYRNRFFYGALEALNGPKLYLTGTGGYDIAEWFEEQLGIEGECLDEGHNVVNFCIEIAQAMGCNPIILIGVDLAFTDMKSYGKGVIANAQVTENELLNVDDLDAKALLKTDIYGNPTYTLWKWVIEADWISEYAKAHPDLSIINATEGGIGFTDIPNVSLNDAIKEHLKKEEDLTVRVLHEYERYPLAYIREEKIVRLMNQMHDSLQRCIDKIDALVTEMTSLTKRIKKGEEYPASLETPTSALLEIDIGEEIGYQYVLNTFNLVYTRLCHRAIQALQTPRRKLSTKKRDLKKIELHIQRLNFIKNVTSVNTALIKHVLKEKANLQT